METVIERRIAGDVQATQRHESRSAALDVLRSVAILLVIGRHLVPHLDVTTASPASAFFLKAWHQIGWAGVDLFFVLSGFLIGGLLFAEINKRGAVNIGRFLFRRGMKVYPAYFAFIGYVLARLIYKSYAATGDLSGMWPIVRDAWPSYILMQNYGGSNAWGHTWSLSVEEHFYILLPLGLTALVLLRKMSWLLPLISLALVACLGFRVSAMQSPGYDPGAIYSQTHFRFDALLIGVALSSLFGRGALSACVSPVGAKWLIAAGCLPVLLIAALPLEHPLVLSFGLTALPIGAAMVIGGFLIREKASEGTASPAVRLAAWIGRNSYCTYLWHVTLIGWVGSAANKAGVDSATLIALGTVVACAVFGRMMTALTERPALLLRDRIAPSLSK